jgi:hypothetical protein
MGSLFDELWNHSPGPVPFSSACWTLPAFFSSPAHSTEQLIGDHATIQIFFYFNLFFINI